MQYAINITDMQRDPIIAQWLVAPVCPSRQWIKAEGDRIDGNAIILECSEERAKAIVELIRNKYKRYELRCYRGTGKAKVWERI